MTTPTAKNHFPSLLNTLSLPPTPPTDSSSTTDHKDHASQRYQFEYIHSEQFLQYPSIRLDDPEQEEEFYMDLLSLKLTPEDNDQPQNQPSTSSSSSSSGSRRNQQMMVPSTVPDLVSGSYQSTISQQHDDDLEDASFISDPEDTRDIFEYEYDYDCTVSNSGSHHDMTLFEQEISDPRSSSSSDVTTSSATTATTGNTRTGTHPYYQYSNGSGNNNTKDLDKMVMFQQHQVEVLKWNYHNLDTAPPLLSSRLGGGGSSGNGNKDKDGTGSSADYQIQYRYGGLLK